jgi:hypothetical protein
MGYPNKTINRGPDVSFTADPAGSAIPAYTRCKFKAPATPLASGKPVIEPCGAADRADVITNEPIGIGSEGACFFANTGGEVYGVCADDIANAAAVYGAADGKISASSGGGAVLAGKMTSQGYTGKISTYSLTAAAA